jgi:hypothetical protein
MDIEYAKKLMDILIENSVRILRAGFGVNAAESAFFTVITLLKEKPDLKTYFLARTISTLSLSELGYLTEGEIPEELLDLVAHETRWDEMKAIAEKRIRDIYHGNSNDAVGDVAQRIIEALSDNWPDREFYKHYQASRL